MQLRTTGHGIGKVKFQRLRLHLTERSGAPVEVELEGGSFPVIYDPSAWQEDRATAMRLIPNLMMRYFLLSLLPGVLLAAIRGKLPEDDESWLEWLAKNNLLYLAGVLPVVRDIIPTIAGKGTGQMTPASQAVGAVTAVGHHAFDDEDDWGQPRSLARLRRHDRLRLPPPHGSTHHHRLQPAGGGTHGRRTAGGEGFDKEEVNSAVIPAADLPPVQQLIGATSLLLKLGSRTAASL